MAVIHQWNLQETSGLTVADSVGSNPGVIDGTATLGVPGPGGNLPNAVSLTGTSNTAVDLASTVQLLANQNWSISFWAKQDADVIQGMILGDSTTTQSFVWLSPNTTPAGIRVRNVAGGELDFAVSSAAKQKWTHYVLTHDVSQSTPALSLFLDGVFSATATFPAGIDLDVNVLGGGYSYSPLGLAGGLASLCLYDAVLTAQEIAALHSEGGGPSVDYSNVEKVVLVLGQSNAAGRFMNSQVYSHPSLYASVFGDNVWGELSDTGSHGEFWPLVATRWMADRNETVGFIYAAMGGTGLVNSVEWAAGGSAYNGAIAQVAASGVTKVDAILWFQGERDSLMNVSREDYLAGMNGLLARLHADLPGANAPFVVGQINYGLGSSGAVRSAQVDSWENANIYPGPITYDIGPLVDGVHFKTDAEAITLADRWWAAIDEALFDGTVGSPPKLASAVANGTSVVLTYDRDLEAANIYTANAWTFDDDGSAIAVMDSTKVGVRDVELTLASAPISSARMLTLGAGTSAQGGDVPRGLGGQPALPESVGVSTVGTTPWQVLQVKNLKRAISIS